MKIVVIGSVAGGTSAAAKARRNDEDAEIMIFDMDRDISYSGCGLPYYIGKEVKDRIELTPRDVKFFKDRYGVDIFIQHEVLEIDPTKKELSVKNLQTEEVFKEKYDKLVIGTGAKPIIPRIKGIDNPNVFPLRNVDHADQIIEYIEEQKPQKAVIVGAGFIGLEMVESLVKLGLSVTLVDLANQVMPSMDKDVTTYLENYLEEKGVRVLLETQVTAIEGEGGNTSVVTSQGESINTDMIIMAVGVKPNVGLAKEAGIKIGVTGAIEVNSRMETNLSDIYAVGDCAESFSLLTGQPLYRPLGSTANKMGRIAGDQITGGTLTHRGILGTGIFKIFDLTVAQTGLSEKEAINLGYDVEVIHNIKPNQPAYYPGGSEMMIKAIADRKTEKLLGVQILGRNGVDKRLDVFVTAITFGALVSDLFHLDLGYAPPYSTTKDPVMYTGMALDNAINRGRPLMTLDQVLEHQNKGTELLIVDVRAEKQYEAGHVPSAINIPLANLREQAKDLDKRSAVVTYCNSGVSGNAAQNILINLGFKEVYNLSGGHKNYFKKI